MHNIYSIVLCGSMWISRVKKYKILNPTQLLIEVVFNKLKQIQNTTNITEITENLLNPVCRTNIQLVRISHQLSTAQI